LESKKEQNVSRTRTGVHSSSPCVILERKEERNLNPNPHPHPPKKKNTQHNTTQHNTTQGERFRPTKKPEKTRNKSAKLRGEMRREKDRSESAWRACSSNNKKQSLKRHPKGRKEKGFDLWIS
jgi:hypothetical protein